MADPSPRAALGRDGDSAGVQPPGGPSERKFEAWVKVLLSRHLGCVVVDLRHVRDGRDLIARHAGGDIVVDCRHAQATVGPQELQELHDALLADGRSRGMVVTRGHFSPAARELAADANGVELQLIDRAGLAYIAETVGLGEGQEATAEAVPTLPDARIVELVRTQVLAPRVTDAAPPEPEITRSTVYAGYYLAAYRATGSLDTPVGTRQASWRGRAWCRHDGSEAGLDSPPELAGPGAAGTSAADRVALGDALRASPGASSPPAIGAQEAVGVLKEHLASTLTRSVRYTGGDEQTHTSEITPEAANAQISDVRLVYLPRQRLSIEPAHAPRLQAHLREAPRGDGAVTLLLRAEGLGSCRTCRHPVGDDDHILCAVCLRATHRRRLLAKESIVCGDCGAEVCRDHARRAVDAPRCVRCVDEAADELPPRWRAHALAATAATLLALLLVVTTSGALAWVGAAAAVAAWVGVGAVARPGPGEDGGWRAYPPAGAG